MVPFQYSSILPDVYSGDSYNYGITSLFIFGNKWRIRNNQNFIRKLKRNARKPTVTLHFFGDLPPRQLFLGGIPVRQLADVEQNGKTFHRFYQLLFLRDY